MSTMLPDGSIIPSYLGSESMGVANSNKSFSQIALRQGEVREIVYPDNPKSVTKKVVEYDVVVSYRDDNGPAYSLNYPNCQVANLFGGTADKVRYTVRAQTKEPGQGRVVSDGSKVLVLCINGEIRRGFIIGGINEDPAIESKDMGHNLLFEFNGVRATVNKDGECTIKFRGATKVDGTLDDNADPDAEGSTLTFNKEGSIKLATKDEKQYTYLNHKDKKIEILADEEWNVKVNKKMVVTSGDNIEIHTDKEMKLDASNNVKVTSAGVLVGNATDKWPLFSTYRQSESSMHQDFLQNFTQLGIAIGVIGASLTTASAAHVVPIAGPIIGAPAIAAAGSAAIQAAQAFVKLSAAVGQFEGKTTTYESTKNKND